MRPNSSRSILANNQTLNRRPASRPRIPGARTGLLVLTALALGLLGAAPAKAPVPKKAKPVPELARIRFWTAPDHTRLVFDLTANPGARAA